MHPRIDGALQCRRSKSCLRKASGNFHGSWIYNHVCSGPIRSSLLGEMGVCILWSGAVVTHCRIVLWCRRKRSAAMAGCWLLQAAACRIYEGSSAFDVSVLLEQTFYSTNVKTYKLGDGDDNDSSRSNYEAT